MFAHNPLARRAALTTAAVATTIAVGAGVVPDQAFARAPDYVPGVPTVGDRWFPSYGNGGYDSLHDDVTFTYNPTTHRIDGTTTIRARATQDLSRFDLDLDGMTVDSVRVDDRAATYTRSGHKLIVTPRRGIRRNRVFTVAVRYAGTPRHVGSGPTETGLLPTNDGAFAVDNTIASDTWFPADDHPLDKATYTFRITVPKSVSAVANGRLVAQRAVANGTTYVWRERDPMATYLATVDIGHWQIKSGTTPGGIPEYVAVDPQLATKSPASDGPKQADPLTFFYDTTAEVTDQWTKTFGPYPFDSTGAIADYTDIGGEPAGFSEETQTRPVYGSVLDETDIAHELAHQWFGDSVSITDFSDIWLNEGFATWAAWYWNELHGSTSAAETARQNYASADSTFWSHRVTPALNDGQGGARVYLGGAMALQFLRERVGDATFFTLLRGWVAEHRYGHGTTAQFEALADRVTGTDLTAFFDTWVYGTGKPALP